jgi:hypothetical protein
MRSTIVLPRQVFYRAEAEVPPEVEDDGHDTEDDNQCGEDINGDDAAAAPPYVPDEAASTCKLTFDATPTHVTCNLEPCGYQLFVDVRNVCRKYFAQLNNHWGFVKENDDRTAHMTHEHRVSYHMAHVCRMLKEDIKYPLFFDRLEQTGSVVRVYADVPRTESSGDAVTRTLRQKNEDTLLANTLRLRAWMDVLNHAHFTSPPNPINIIVPVSPEVEIKMQDLNAANLLAYEEYDRNSVQEVASNKDAVQQCMATAAAYVDAFMQEIAREENVTYDLCYVKTRLSLHPAHVQLSIVQPAVLATKYEEEVQSTMTAFVNALTQVIGLPDTVRASRMSSRAQAA